MMRNAQLFLGDLRNFLNYFMDPKSEEDSNPVVQDLNLSVNMMIALEVEHQSWKKKPLSKIVGSKRLDYQILFPPSDMVNFGPYSVFQFGDVFLPFRFLQQKSLKLKTFPMTTLTMMILIIKIFLLLRNPGLRKR